MAVNKTLNYYNQNASHFVADTLTVEFASMQDKFLRYLAPKSCILDFGCGSGRDTKYFLEKEFVLEAIDGSKELCKIASAYTGIEVKHQLFQELKEVEQYDGIWACSSILHLEKLELKNVLEKMCMATKKNGVIYTSFKYGTFEGERNGRYFTDMTEESFAKLIQDVEDLVVEEQWVTADVRPGRGEEKWLNLILRKK